MFRCEACHFISKPNETQHKVVVEKREKRYSEPLSDRESFGWEVVREKAVCSSCAAAARGRETA